MCLRKFPITWNCHQAMDLQKNAASERGVKMLVVKEEKDADTL